MDRFSDVDGVCPWLPSEMEDLDKEVWADGLRFESRFYDLDREPSMFSPSDLSDELRGDRAAALRDLFKATRSDCLMVYQETIMTVDRVLLSHGRLPDNMTMRNAVAACYLLRRSIDHRDVAECAAKLTQALDLAPGLMHHASQINQMLGYFAERDMYHTPLDWMVRYTDMMPDVLQKRVVKAEIEVIVSVIGACGSLARHRPSTVAAAAMVLILDEQAEPYLCGYDFTDVATALAEVRKIVDCYM